MWELGNLWTHEVGQSSNTPVAASSSYLSVMHEIHVLLVDHDSDSLINTAKLLELCQYRVTLVELASGAIQTLSAGKVKFDIVMANVNSPDLHGFKLLQHAASMDIPVILMSFDDNTFMAMRALESGAFLYVKKPATKEMLKCLWQHVAREKIRLAKERELLLATNYGVRGIEFREAAVHPADENPNNVGGNNTLNLHNVGGNNMIVMDDKLKKNGYINGRKGLGGEDFETRNRVFSSKIKRKVCTEWTQELHEKFMDAVEQLGEGRCFPKEILELMNVPGLTRMQVASHLQKCRNDNWRSPEERKSNSNSQNASSDPDHASPHKPRRFGSMPKIGKASSKETSGGGTVHGESSKPSPSQADQIQNDGGVENMEAEPAVTVTKNTNSNNNNNHPLYHQHYGPMVPLPGNMGPPPVATYSENPRTTSVDHYFNFSDMDCLVQNYSGLTQVNAGGYHFESVYRHHDQNTKVPNVDNRSRWSSETTSNFGSDHDSETRGH